MGTAAAYIVSILAATMLGTRFTMGGTFVLGLGLSGLASAALLQRPSQVRLRSMLHTCGVVVAALGTVGLEMGDGLFLGFPGLFVLGALLLAVTLMLTARARVTPLGAAAFGGAGAAVVAAALVLAVEVVGRVQPGPWPLWVIATAVGVATSVVLWRGWRRIAQRPAEVPSRRGAWTAGAAAVLLLGSSGASFAGFPIGRAAAAAEVRLQGQAPPRLPGSGWIYFSQAGGPRFISSQVVLLPAPRGADGHCRNGASQTGPGRPAGAGPYAETEIAFNPVSCEVAVREGPVAR